ncbi:MAG: hypothetical protein HND52_07430 [Ignavibacteriae bacterium]|nr:hypothetical protein [Ignavibacteriota bacterium]NOG97776.1 hypothetical protein [Ignavibacteriota bacterium]
MYIKIFRNGEIEMKLLTIVLINLFLCISIAAQNFLVETVSGDVKYLSGTEEEWKPVTKGLSLNGNDVLLTDNKSYVKLNKDGNRFILQSNSALGLNHIEKVSINDLLLALAMEEIRNVPKTDGKGNTKNTVVYGSETKGDEQLSINSSDFGIKRLNGAKQLAENGFKESAVIVAKETYRKYPDTKKLFEERLFFADLLAELNLYEEAFSELNSISNLELQEDETDRVNSKIEKVKMEMANK